MENITELITDEMEKQGKLEFVIADSKILDQQLKEFTVFYKIVGESRLKLFRNNRMELAFVRLNDDWMRQAKINISGFTLPLEVRLTWDNQTADQLAVKGTNGDDYKSAQSMQIDN